MGVPKFYRWISERYPCLSEVVKEFQIPEFDNLYLDMNGIVHVCSHPEDDNPHFRITEEKIFADIMYYIEFLFRMIKPRKVFFMAVDGVAPRAKMNQQRGRRFRSAREAEELEKRAMQKGETLPTEKRFDSNCITPGTPFMVRLQEQLKYFVVKKTSTDPLWQGVRVYLSGHETPGEGEHKIMDFIRAERSDVNYDANTRHCLYGLDADLMMLGLASHEPHFSLLREEVRFGGRKDSRNKRPQTPEETTFHLLHLSLFREYLDFEFSTLKNELTTFEYSLENVIDDWVMMGFLVGNDFIPHLPNLHINHDALPLLWRTYIEVLPSCGGYINEGGHLNLERFEKYLTALSKFDFDTFSEQVGDLKWLESKKAEASAGQAEALSAARKLAKNQKKSLSRLTERLERNQFALLDSLDDNVVSSDDLGTELIDSPVDETSEEISEDVSEESDDDTLGDEFRHHKRNYYMTKMEYEKVTPEVLQDQAEGYVRGIQWILLYYYEGVPSWSWYYQHHYAPYMSDVKDFKNMNLRFDLGTPFKPFEQLMAVLPAASKDLLPLPYQKLMINDTSPVIDFYPLQFDTDLNGKQQDWEAVVLIPFIDENRLLTAIRSVEHLLTDEEKARNGHGPHLCYEYTPEAGEPYPSPLPDFPDIAISHSKLTRVHMDEFRIPSEQLRKGMLPGAKLDVFFPGFPTLKHIPHHAELSKEGVKVFQMNSRGYNTMLYIEQEEEEPDIDKVAKEYLGREIYVGWPHMYEAKVIAVSNSEYSYTQEEPAGGKGKAGNHRPQIKREQIDESTYTIYSKEISTIAERYKDRLGIVIGDTHILLRALPMTGRKYIFSSHGRVTMDKQFGKLPVAFAKQATVKDIAVHDSGFCQFRTLKDYLPEGTAVFMLGWPHYACQGEVIETDTESGRVRINLSILEEPQLSNVINHQQVHADRYYSGYVVAQKVGISSHLLSRLTGTIYVTAGEAELAREQANPHKVNVGLNLKFTKRGEEVPGYTKNTEGQWTYSDKVVDVLSQYMDKFPEMFESISKSNKQHNDMYYESDLIPKTCDYTLKTVEEFIKKLPCSGLKTMKSGADIISEGTIKALQELTDQVVEANKKRQKRVKMQVKPHLLYKPSPTSGSLIPDQSAMYQLYDRVVNTRQGFPVPFGLRGTVVGIHPAEVEVNTMYEVIFDDDFQGGISIRNSSKRGYRMPPSGLLNITHGERKNGVKSAIQIPVAAKNQAYQGQQHRNVTNDFSYANASAPRQPGPHQYNQGYGGQQGFQRNRGGYQGLPDNRTGYHDNQYSRGGNQQWDRQARSGNQAGYSRQNDQYERQNNRNTQDTKEDVSGQVFNGASAGTSQPTFVTPKVTSGNQSKRKLSTGESQQNKPGKGQTSGSTEFDNIWKQLQASQPPAADNSSQGLSLSSAAAVLPRVPSPDNASKGSNSNQNNTKIDVQSLFSGASNANDTKTIQPGAQNAKSDCKSQYSSSKVVSNDEFAAMFKSLEEVHISKEENENKPENGTDALKKMLNITDQSESSMSSEAPVESGGASSGGGKSYGRQVSIQELFDGAKKQQVQSDVDKSQEQQNKGKGYQKQKGQGQQSPRQPQGHQGQPQGFQNNVQNKRPALLIPQSRGGNRNPVMELMSFCQSLQMGLPMYDYLPKSGVFYCVVSLFNGARFQGSLCKTKEEAAESAASVALLQLKGSMQQMAAHPMMQMPGFVPGALPQGRQFSSPNSAFSPVNTFTAPGIYQGNRGQSPRGYHGYGQQQQQRPFSGGQGQTHYNRGGYSRQQNNSANQQQGRNQTYQNPQEMTTSQQQGRNQTYQNPQEVIANQNQESKTDERSLFNSQKQSKDVKTQPTCVVTPFVPMQVTRKHTPQKARKTSVSDDNTSRIEEETLEKRGENIPVREVKGDNSMQSNKPKTDSSETISSKPDPSNSRTERKESGSTDSTSPKTKQSTPPKSAKKTETGSAKKSRRRLAANFNVKP